METVLTALLVLALILYSLMAVSTAWITSQRALVDGWGAMQQRAAERAITRIDVTAVTVSGPAVTVVVRNDGENRLTDFADWDLILQYYDLSDQYRVVRLDYSAGSPAGEGWTVGSIYRDADCALPEAYDRDVLNPGEYLALDAALATSHDPQAVHLVVAGTASGVTSSRQFSGEP